MPFPPQRGDTRRKGGEVWWLRCTGNRRKARTAITDAQTEKETPTTTKKEGRKGEGALLVDFVCASRWDKHTRFCVDYAAKRRRKKGEKRGRRETRRCGYTTTTTSVCAKVCVCTRRRCKRSGEWCSSVQRGREMEGWRSESEMVVLWRDAQMCSERERKGTCQRESVLCAGDAEELPTPCDGRM